MNSNLQMKATYGIAVLVLAGAFALIWFSRGTEEQVWLAIGLVLGFVFRDSAGASATNNAERIAAAQPTVSMGGDPPRATVTPPVVDA
jgi:hypothetical protein